MLRRPVRENVSLASLRSLGRFGFVRRRMESTRAKDALRRVAASSELETIPAALSGGNQQKLMFARALLAHPAVLIADEPTRGVDVGAKRDIYELLVELAAGGVAILLISNEIEEVLGLAHRVLVHARRPRRRRARRRRASPRRRSWPRPSAACRAPHDRHDVRRRAGRPRAWRAGAQPAVRRGGILIPFVIAFVILRPDQPAVPALPEPRQHPRPAVRDHHRGRRRHARPDRGRHRPLGRRDLRPRGRDRGAARGLVRAGGRRSLGGIAVGLAGRPRERRHRHPVPDQRR